MNSFVIIRMWTMLFWLLAMVLKMVSPTGSSKTHGALTGVTRVTSRWKWARTCAVSIPHTLPYPHYKNRDRGLQNVVPILTWLEMLQVLLLVHPTLLSRHEDHTDCSMLYLLGVNNTCLAWAWWWVIHIPCVVNRSSWREWISPCLYVPPLWLCR